MLNIFITIRVFLRAFYIICMYLADTSMFFYDFNCIFVVLIEEHTFLVDFNIFELSLYILLKVSIDFK